MFIKMAANAASWMILVFFCAHGCHGNGSANLDSITKEFWEWRMMISPTFSTYLGYYEYNDLLNTFNFSNYAKQVADIEAFLQRLDSIPTANLTFEERVNKDILNDTFHTYINGYKYAKYGASAPINFLGGVHIYWSLAKAATNTIGDFENYLARLTKFPNQIAELIDLMRITIAENTTLHNVSIEAVPGQIESLLVEDPVQSAFYWSFNGSLDAAIGMNDDQKESFRNRGKVAVNGVVDAYRQLQQFIVNEYIPKTRNEYGVGSLPAGREYYQECLKWHLSFDMTPEQVHEVGLQEVARIHAEMTKIKDSEGFQGSVREFFLSLLNDSRFILNTPEEVIEMYEDIIHKQINTKLPEYFKDIPDIPIIVRGSTMDGIAGGYGAATEDSPGVFYLNLFRLRDNPTFEFMALALHEANPGHHLQHIYGLAANIPDYRSQAPFSVVEVPFYFPFYSSYSEGWALYSEYLGEEMGLYKTPYDMMGRYTMEMLRAVRLVVDTGIHYFGWSQPSAIEYLMNYTSYSIETATIEINRYITWPGQACAYKLGEIRMKELRKKAEDELGDWFDIREFHSVVLKNGPVPMRILENLIDKYIADTKANPPSVATPSSATQIRATSTSIFIAFLYFKQLF